MKNAPNNNIFFNLIQPKIFNFLQYNIPEDDPVRKLSAILEEMDFSKLLQVFPYKTKVHPIRMFAIILFAYSRGIYSTRDIEVACQENIKFRFLLQDSKLPDHSTISRFLNKIEAFLPELFQQFTKIIFEKENISTDTIYIDGTKIEAYANRYSFVWKKSIKNYWSKLNDKIQNFVLDFNQEFNFNLSSFFEICNYLENLNIDIIHERGKRKSKEQKYLELSREYFKKYEKYLNHFQN